MKVTAGEKAFEIDPDDLKGITSFKELSAIERACGVAMNKLEGLPAIGAMVWTLVKRQDSTVRIDDIDFDIADLPDEDKDDEAEAPLG